VISPWKSSDEKQARSTPNEDRPRQQKLSVAGQALEKLGGGIQTTRAIADAAGLDYQKAYRQLGRDAAVEKHENGWVLS
jgi:hypothetical protein